MSCTSTVVHAMGVDYDKVAAKHYVWWMVEGQRGGDFGRVDVK